MKKTLVLILSAILITGCFPVYLGAAAVTGYALGNDSAIGLIKISYRDLWDFCVDALTDPKIEIVYRKESDGIIKAETADGVDVSIKIDSMDAGQQQLKVSARKYMLPKPHEAQKIFTKIIKEIE